MQLCDVTQSGMQGGAGKHRHPDNLELVCVAPAVPELSYNTFRIDLNACSCC